MIPEIKSINFLNLHHLDFLSNIQNEFKSILKPKKQEDLVIPIDVNAIDVLCVNCYECIKIDNVDIHSIECNSI